MQTITLYRYTRPDGGVTVSPILPDAPYTTAYRLIADSGKLLTRNGSEPAACVDTDSPEGWTEIEDTGSYDPEKADMAAALDLLGVTP